jgi:hypothetical protein
MTERQIGENEQVIECRNCGSKWSVNTVSKEHGQVIGVLMECPLCERKEVAST